MCVCVCGGRCIFKNRIAGFTVNISNFKTQSILHHLIMLRYGAASALQPHARCEKRRLINAVVNRCEMKLISKNLIFRIDSEKPITDKNKIPFCTFVIRGYLMGIRGDKYVCGLCNCCCSAAARWHWWMQAIDFRTCFPHLFAGKRTFAGGTPLLSDLITFYFIQCAGSYSFLI